MSRMEYRFWLWHFIEDQSEAILNDDAAKGWRYRDHLPHGILLEREVGDDHPHKPRRGDDVEQWLKYNRDAQGDQETLNETTFEAMRVRARWEALDNLLDRYRECADYGLTLRGEDTEKGDP